jgi:hypothetical protein
MSKTQTICPFTKERCRKDCEWFTAEAKCVMYSIWNALLRIEKGLK